MVRASIRSTPDEDLQYRRQEVKANGKTMITPIKSINPANTHQPASGGGVKYIHEGYAGLTEEKLKACATGGDKDFTYRINRIVRQFQNPNNSMYFLILEIKSQSLPSPKEIEFVADLAYACSDMTPLPMLSNFVHRITNHVSNSKSRSPSENKFKLVKQYITDTIETIDQLNHKPTMGYIPDYKYYFDELIKLYVKHDINVFYFDAHLSNPLTLQTSLRALTRTLARHEILEDSFIHMINPGIGRAPKGSSAIPAKDVLGFGFGIDGLGEVHMRRRFNYAMREAMAENPDNRHKLFDKEKYKYLKISKESEIRKFYPKDSSIDMSEFLRPASDKSAQKAFNAEQLALEGKRLQYNLAHSSPLVRYLKGKAGVTEGDMRALKSSKVRHGK